MEAPVGITPSVVVALVCIFISWASKVLNWVWLRPKKLEACLREQGLKGNPYRLLWGDLKESSIMLDEANSKPMDLSHDIAPRVLPFIHHSVNIYGEKSFIWNGPTPRLHISNPEDLKDVFTNYEDFLKPTTNPLAKFLVTGLANYEDDKWAKHRRIINPAFHLEKLKRMLPAFYQICNEMIEEWESLVSKEASSCELDVWPYLHNLTADVISRTAFGSSYKEGRKIFQILTEQQQLVIKAGQSVYIPGWRFLPTKLNKKLKENDREMRVVLKGIINKREEAIQAGKATKDDLLGVLMDSNLKEIKDHGNNQKVGMSIEDVVEECKLFYFAGQETTSVLLTWTMVLLSQYQEWQHRAREEVLQVFGSNKPDFDGLTHLKVVTMILHEVLRLYPAVVVLVRKTEKKTQLGKLSLPSGVEMTIPALQIHQNKQLWGDDAKEFKPERFSEGVSKATKNRFSYFPFGGGPRLCIGQSFALMEAKMALALILQHFTFELSPSYVHAPLTLFTLQPQFGACMILHKH